MNLYFSSAVWSIQFSHALFWSKKKISSLDKYIYFHLLDRFALNINNKAILKYHEHLLNQCTFFMISRYIANQTLTSELVTYKFNNYLCSVLLFHSVPPSPLPHHPPSSLSPRACLIFKLPMYPQSNPALCNPHSSILFYIILDPLYKFP